MRRLRKAVFSVLLCGASGLTAGVLVQPIPAPEWEISAWLNDDAGSLRDHQGRVVLIEFARLGCPDCKSFLIPLFRRWNVLYGDRKDVLIVSVLSALDNGESQSPERLRAFVRENGIRHAVGIDAYDSADGSLPVTMRRYRTGDTPHLAIVDRQGLLRFSHFGFFDPGPIEAFIQRLLEEPPGTSDRWSESARPREQSRPTLDPRLSGTYRFRINEATGVCADWIPRMEVPAELRVYGDSIDVEFRRPFLGLHDLGARYDSPTGQVEGLAVPVGVVGGGLVAKQGFRLEGVLDGQADPPQLEFELSLLDGKCVIQGRARR